MILKIILGAFTIAWIGIIYSIITAPLVDEYGNIIKENKKQNMGKLKMNFRYKVLFFLIYIAFSIIYTTMDLICILINSI